MDDVEGCSKRNRSSTCNYMLDVLDDVSNQVEQARRPSDWKGLREGGAPVEEDNKLIAVLIS